MEGTKTIRTSETPSSILVRSSSKGVPGIVVVNVVAFVAVVVAFVTAAVLVEVVAVFLVVAVPTVVVASWKMDSAPPGQPVRKSEEAYRSKNWKDTKPKVKFNKKIEKDILRFWWSGFVREQEDGGPEQRPDPRQIQRGRGSIKIGGQK